MKEVLHLTPHLGGGVGKALAALVGASRSHPLSFPVKHVFVCLEHLEKDHFLRQIQAVGCEVVIKPEQVELERRIAATDIVQVEWWNHPATIAALCSISSLRMRLLIWCHQSGLKNPLIPAGLANSAQRFVLTSPCSLRASNIRNTPALKGGRVVVISSGVGCDELPPVPARDFVCHRPLVVGYLGSLNFSKLHPEYVTWLSAVDHLDFRVRLIGDELNRAELEQQCVAAGRPGLVEFAGYKEDVAGELAGLDVLAYLLNPRHYGTAENALLEAMAMGVVPVVLNNPVEKKIVTHGQTGLVVASPSEFKDAIRFLTLNPSQRAALSERAAQESRITFTGRNLLQSFSQQYEAISAEPKKETNFHEIFGTSPAEWFLACQDNPSFFGTDGTLSMQENMSVPHDLLEKSKSSVFHYHKYFPNDQVIRKWTEELSSRFLT